MSYRQSVLRTLNPALLADKQQMLINAGMGLSGESGEVIDLLKKHLFHGHDLDRTKLLKELGDVRFYLELAIIAADTTVEEVEAMNDAKRLARYPNGFTTEASKARVDEHQDVSKSPGESKRSGKGCCQG